MPPEFSYYRVVVTLRTPQGAWLYHGDDCGNLFRPDVDVHETRFGSAEAAGRAAETVRRLSPAATVEVLGEYDYSDDPIPF